MVNIQNRPMYPMVSSVNQILVTPKICKSLHLGAWPRIRWNRQTFLGLKCRRPPGRVGSLQFQVISVEISSSRYWCSENICCLWSCHGNHDPISNIYIYIYYIIGMFFSLLVKVKPNFPQLIVRKEHKPVAPGGMASWHLLTWQVRQISATCIWHSYQRNMSKKHLI